MSPFRAVALIAADGEIAGIAEVYSTLPDDVVQFHARRYGFDADFTLYADGEPDYVEAHVHDATELDIYLGRVNDPSKP